ncbi:MAG: SMI1/KNR4 family protein [Saprospiraceae bacterium]|nr:SMI1/KNR4 family protein [Saprospiraceae bacterium]
MGELRIKAVVDKYFDFMEETGGLFYMADEAPEEMLNDNVVHFEDDDITWSAINSTVSAQEIEALESYYRHRLPSDYVAFLKHRHFVHLQMGSYQVAFFKNLPGRIVIDTKEKIKNYYWNLIERNYLPFAALSDFGVLCFDANIAIPNNDYPVVEFSHEGEYEEAEQHASSFADLFIEFESHLDEWITTYRGKQNEQL